MSEYQRYNTRSSKLTFGEVQEIRQLYHEQGWSQGRLARKFNMSVVQIGRIVRGESQRKVPELADTSDADIDPNAIPLSTEEQEHLNAQAAKLVGPIPARADPTPVPPDQHKADLANLVEALRKRKAELEQVDSQQKETRNEDESNDRGAGEA